MQAAGDNRVRKCNILWNSQESTHQLLQIYFASKYTIQNTLQKQRAHQDPY